MSRTPASSGDAAMASWADLLREGRAFYAVLILLGVLLHALQILVIAIIMPTVVADVGGAAFYTWAAMLYTIGSIVGSASVGPLWTALGTRRGYAVSGFLLLVGTTGCAAAPDMATLIAARAVQGYAGGLVIGGSMALIGGLFGGPLRTRMLAGYQGVWMVAQLCGPLVGGVFAEIGWWRGSFWTLVPIILVFATLAWLRLPDRLENEDTDQGKSAFPVLRLAMLGAGVFAVALAGPVTGNDVRLALIVAAAALVWLTFRRDRKATNRLWPASTLSLRSPVGLALWILFCVGLVQTSVTLFLPLLLQVVHGVTPLFISYVTITISFGWTVGTFAVAGWTGARERVALWAGPLLMLAGMAGMTATAQFPGLIVLTVSAFVLGLGIGCQNVHLVARTMAAAMRGEERITAAAMPSFRSLGTAFGAALAGMLSTIGGLGDATDATAVGNAVTVVYGFDLLPLVAAALFSFALARAGPPDRQGP
jgi:MFS family permease